MSKNGSNRVHRICYLWYGFWAVSWLIKIAKNQFYNYFPSKVAHRWINQHNLDLKLIDSLFSEFHSTTEKWIFIGNKSPKNYPFIDETIFLVFSKYCFELLEIFIRWQFRKNLVDQKHKWVKIIKFQFSSLNLENFGAAFFCLSPLCWKTIFWGIALARLPRVCLSFIANLDILFLMKSEKTEKLSKKTK